MIKSTNEVVIVNEFTGILTGLTITCRDRR